MSQYPKVILKAGKENSLRRRHPWVFSGAIQHMDKAADGEVVEVTTNKGDFLAIGQYQQGSITVRVLSFNDAVVDAGFWEQKLNSAITFRTRLGLINNTQTNAYRLVNAEGDGLSGLVIDYYNGNAVIQPHSIGMELIKQQIAHALANLLGNQLTGIYAKSPERERQNDGYILGNQPDTVMLENGNSFYINWVEGQKTGFFIDQRENRALLATYAKGKKVLNAFCYSGGFSVYALNAGASEVWSVDSSKKAIEWTDKNVSLNQHQGIHHSIVSDVQDFLKATDEQFEVMVLDPPAYAKHLSARHQAVQGYKRLNALGLKSVKPGGVLFTFSCSQAVDFELFYNTIVAAAIEAGRNIRVMHRLFQPPDHAVSIYHPEGSYLKGLVLYVE